MRRVLLALLALVGLAGSAGRASAQALDGSPGPQLTCLPVARLQLGLEIGGDPFFWRQRLRLRDLEWRGRLDELEWRDRFAPAARFGVYDRFRADAWRGRFGYPCGQPSPYWR